MTRKKWFCIGILGLVLVFALVFTACDNDPGPGTEEPDEEIVDPAAAEKPLITDQSGTKRYLAGSTIEPLSVTATISDGGSLSYQWYSIDTFANEGGDALEGETGTTYQPPVDAEGTAYYYAVVTNTKPDAETGETKTSETASAPIGVIVLTALPGTDAAITVTSEQAQYVRGFGGMSNAFTIGNAANPARYMEMRDIETMFNPETGLGLKMLRIMIWPQGFEQIVSGQVEPQMNNASTYLNAVKKVNEYGGYVLASPWTAPAHMKTNDSLDAGGHLKPTMYADYANHLRTFASSMAASGAPLYAISIQNEPSLVVSYNGMEWEPSEHQTFLRNNGNFTRSPTPVSGYGGGKAQDYVKIVSGEPHNVGTWYNEAIDMVLDDEAAYANLDIAAYHIYGGDGNRGSVTRNGRLTRETWMTEYNINGGNDAAYLEDSKWDLVWLFANTIHHVIADNDSSAFVWWYLKRFYGVIGDGSYGTVNGAIMPRGYALSHYAKYATDTVRVNATTTHPGGTNIRLSAYQRKTAKSTEVEKQVMADEDSYSIVIYDQRTSGSGQTSLRINLPDGFTATKVYGIISDSTGNRHAPLEAILNPDGKSADVTLPVNAIISVKLVK